MNYWSLAVTPGLDMDQRLAARGAVHLFKRQFVHIVFDY